MPHGNCWGQAAGRPGKRGSGKGGRASFNMTPIGGPGKGGSGTGAPGMRGPGMRCSQERGSGTLLVAGVVFVLMAITAAILVVGGYLVAADRARGAADLVAVSAAAEQAGLGQGCRVAASVARLNGVQLMRCLVEGDSLDFVVSVTVRQPVRTRLPLLPDGVPATSHAGRLGVMSRG